MTEQGGNRLPVVKFVATRRWTARRVERVAAAREPGRVRVCAFALLAVIALAPSACADDARTVSSDTGVSPASPVGSVWRWRELQGGEPIEVPHPGRYTLELLEDDRYRMRVDCNSGGGSYTIAGERLELSPGPMTLVACGPESLDRRFLASLGEVESWQRDAGPLTLTLRGDAGAMVFDALEPITPQSTSWLLRGYNNGRGGVVGADLRDRLELRFGAEGTLSGSSGCNRFTGSYELAEGSLRIGPLATTRRACRDESAMAREAAILAALSTVASWEMRGERLQLRRSDGALALDAVSVVTGAVSRRSREALRPGSQLEVSVQDVSLADAPAVVIGRQQMEAAGQPTPIPFAVTFDPAEIDVRHSYSLRATIHRGGKLVYTSTQSYPVITRDAPRYDVAIEIHPVGP